MCMRVLLCTCVCARAHTWMCAHTHKAVEVRGQFCGVDTFLNLCMDSEDLIQVSRYNHLYILSHVAWMSMNLVLRGTKINKESVRVEESRASETDKRQLNVSRMLITVIINLLFSSPWAQVSARDNKSQHTIHCLRNPVLGTHFIFSTKCFPQLHS